MSIWTALLMLAATIVGSAAVIAACCFAATGFAALFGRLIGPASPELSAEEQARRAEAQRREDEDMERRWEERGRLRADSTSASFRVFGWVFLAAYLLVSLSSILAHADDPGHGFPLQLALRPLWFASAVALMAGIMAGSRYQKRFRRLSPREQREFLERQRAEARSAHTRRLARIRGRADPRLLGGRR